MLNYPKSIIDNTVGNIKYRNNVVTGVVAADNGNNTYDVFINSEDVAFPNIPTTILEPVFTTGEAVEILMEYGSKEMPIIIGYAKKIVQDVQQIDMNVLVTTLDTYGTSNSRTYLEGRIEDIEGYENCLLRGFHYGLTTAYGSDTYTTGSFAAGSYAIQTTGLTANTAYNFCAYVYDADGDEQKGDNMSFTTLEGHYLYSADYATGVISKHSGISETILDTFYAPSGVNMIGGIANDGTNLISIGQFGAVGLVYVHDGFSSGVSSSFNAPNTFPCGLAFDGTNLISSDWGTDLIYVHDGISSGITSSFPSPGSDPDGLTVIGGNLISCDDILGNIYVHIGITSGIASSFAAPNPWPRCLANDGTNLISGNWGATGDNKIYVHSGVTSGITSTLDAPAGYTNIYGLTYTT